jgi:hypothetical protein
VAERYTVTSPSPVDAVVDMSTATSRCVTGRCVDVATTRTTPFWVELQVVDFSTVHPPAGYSDPEMVTVALVDPPVVTTVWAAIWRTAPGIPRVGPVDAAVDMFVDRNPMNDDTGADTGRVTISYAVEAMGSS